MSLLPLALAQRLWWRLAGARLPSPPGPRSGWSGVADGEPLRLLVMGDSLALGVGVDAVERSLAPRLAYRLGMLLRRRVVWQVRAGRHWTAAELLRSLTVAGTPEHDIGVVVLGINDLLGLTGIGRWRRQLARLMERMDDAGGQLLLHAGPVMQRQSSSLPWPMKALLADRLRQLGAGAAEVLRARPAGSQLHGPLLWQPDPAVFAADGLHLSAAGHARAARELGDRLAAAWLAQEPRSTARLSRQS